MITLEQHETIRRLHYIDKLSNRAIAARLEISRRTVTKALAHETVPTYTLSKPRPAPQLGAFKGRVEQLLADNKLLPKKQRYTAHKIFQLLQAEGYSGSESSVQAAAVAFRKTNRKPQVFLPLEFDPGQEAQVDWGVAQACIAGVMQTVQLFVMRLNYSRRSFVRAYPSQKQEAFFEGHVLAFQHFGGIAHRLSYDNLAAAVKILLGLEGRVREENRAFIALRSYYLFESHFCTPGQGHEKGGVEHSVGFSRRNFMVPIPHVASFEELNAYLLGECGRDDVRVVAGQSASIGQLWQVEKPYLRPLPLRAFECCVTRQARLTPYSQVVFETNRYSVPTDQVRAELVVKAYPFRIDILRPGGGAGSGESSPAVVATHYRCYEKNQDVFDPLHYLALLEQRPGAFEHAKPLRRWRKEWPPSYQRALDHLIEKWPEGRGVREFIAILKLHQTHPAALVEQAVSQALLWGCVHLDGVTHCLHQLGQPQQLTLPLLDLSNRPELAAIGSQPVALEHYDQLLLIERQA